MDLIGFLDDIVDLSNKIDMGRKGLTIDGREHEGRLNYERGISGTLDSFKTAQLTADPKTIILAELIFLRQEFQYCHETDIVTKNSLTLAIQSFEDALRCLTIVKDKKDYRAAEATHPTSKKYRVKGYPKDAFHLACNSHRTRLQNVLKSPGINMIEKTVLQKRLENMAVAQAAYTAKQKAVLG